MNKSVYSLVLSDEVVEAVDREAYRAGMSRSAYINKLLAEAVSYTTPEQRMNDIFTAVESLMDDGIFRIMPRPSETVLALRSALQYKYKPVIRYGIELYRSFGGSDIGRLKVSLRTQSEALIADFTKFIALWSALEKTYITDHFPDGITYTVEKGRFTRTFCLPPDKQMLSDSEIAAALSEYVKMFDEIIKLYFANSDSEMRAKELAVRRYKAYFAEGIPII